jgi:glucosylceramidase
MNGDISLEHFSIEKDKEYIIPIIKEILEIKPDLMLFASPWSPPGWMKTGGSVGGGYMREKYLDCYADYFVKYIKAYAAEGITISAVTPQNEPETHQGGKMPACMWHPDTEAKFISILRNKFDENAIDTKIWCYDHTFSGVTRVAWCLKEYPSLKNACAGIAFHYYTGSIEQTAFLKDAYPELQLHFTEGGPRLYDNYDTDWCKWTLMMIKALCNGYSSFTGWNLMLDETGGPNVGPFFCGGLVTRNAQSGELSYSGQYKAFRHFKGITPASEIRPLLFDNEATMSNFSRKCTLHTEGCFIKSESGVTGLILVNPSDKKEQIQYFYCNEWWYIEMLPNTSATIIFEE